MCKTLALLSGKGGSGKTTLALSVATMLSKCEIKVLLIDCDLSTNGATYFYEDKLTEYGKNIKSFYNEIINPYNKGKLININDYMDFMPSIIQITKENTAAYSYKERDIEILQDLRRNYGEKYDVILFDCQAGYTDILKLILPIVDINLFIMEADAISSSAIRSLYLKIGDFLNEKKVYQVFNKATDEEYQVYSKLSGGTVFTNIETVMFDWKIRKAFSVAEIPDMENTSASYGVQIYTICSILFKDKSIQEKLSKFKVIIEFNKNKEEEKRIKQKISMLQTKREKSKNRINQKVMVSFFAGFLSILCVFFYRMIDQKILSDYTDFSFMIAIIFIMMILIMSSIVIIMMDTLKERNSYYKEIEMYNKQLKTILKDKQELQDKHNIYYKDEDDL